MSGRLLIVDDCVESNRALEVLFAFQGVEVRVAPTLAARAALEWEADAVLLARALKDGEGMTLLPLLLGMEPAPAVAFYTALPMPAVEIPPAVAYFRKPVTVAQLLAWYAAPVRTDGTKAGGGGHLTLI